MKSPQEIIRTGQAILGIELGSTRIKAVLIKEDGTPIAAGSSEWDNQYKNDYWTYDLEEAWKGIRLCYRHLCEVVFARWQCEITSLAAIGISGMMHGYLVFDEDGKQLTAFRTWRNTTTEPAAEALTQQFQQNIPQRWSIAHLYQAMLNKEEHVGRIDYMTTLAGYIHWKLTGKRVLGIGEASGVFPIDSQTCDYDIQMIAKFDALTAEYWAQPTVRAVLPQVLCAGADAGTLTESGAKLLDPTGNLQAGIPLCPPEGDAGTGMVATNSIIPRTGNVSAGTSIFAMVVLERKLCKVHREIDLVTTPTGRPVAMVHCNNCTSDLNAWAKMLCEFALESGATCTLQQALDILFCTAGKAAPDCGGLMSINYISGEPITGLASGCPVFTRGATADFNLKNFARAHIYSALATLTIGMDILQKDEAIKVDMLMAHGGFFKAKDTGAQLLSAALDVPVSTLSTAGEGGPWGMALLAAFHAKKRVDQNLESFLSQNIFASDEGTCYQPEPQNVVGFKTYLKCYRALLQAENTVMAAFK